ncbi:hypothetical protein DACRYDRAFT_25485 [Dacryopinax primogenitus]|uniref:Uncharacterized protein n=1 Tax=Dacryopinax primogenitus (strain DJM 731) TaxID=1858805 RepID=M5FQ79_DACPD|nr:uncharacterized protein DACRYDRAFT_25485 [Dacryopinax primogenitus]EJT96794.1 hypothetical protein DACRYDRAFT_25485 [Dacryopinax primogenitus]
MIPSKRWDMGSLGEDETLWMHVNLQGNTGNYHAFPRQVKKRDRAVLRKEERASLGNLTRSQRDTIISVGHRVNYSRDWIRSWLWRLLKALAYVEGVLDPPMVDSIIAECQLRPPVHEADGSPSVDPSTCLKS